MSALMNALPFPSRKSETPKRHLSPVTGGKGRKPRVMYAVTALLGVGAIVAAQMGISIASAQASHEISALNAENRELTLQAQVLQGDISGLDSPQYIAANAAEKGMVVASSPSYLRLSDGAVVGSGEAAGSTSTVNAQSRASVPNALVANTPLATRDDVTMGGHAVVSLDANATPEETTDADPTPGTVEAAAVDPEEPPVVDSIPSPSTR